MDLLRAMLMFHSMGWKRPMRVNISKASKLQAIHFHDCDEIPGKCICVLSVAFLRAAML